MESSTGSHRFRFSETYNSSVVGGDPVLDVTKLHDVQFVMKSGAVVQRHSPGPEQQPPK